MTESFVPVPGGRLFVVDEGPADGPPIHLLHAGIADLRAWDAMVPPLITAGYRVIRHDARGFGRTETDDIDYSARADVLAVLDSCGVDRVALIGNSMGGSDAFDTAIETPERVVVVVGVAAGLRGFDVESTADEEARFLAMEAVETAMDASTGDARADHVEQLVALETRFWMDGPGQPTDRVPAHVRDALTAMNRLHLTPKRAEGRRIPLDPPAASRLDELRCPVMAVAGLLDVSDVVATARHLEDHAPNTHAVILPDVAHMIGMEAPDRLKDLVVDFLAPLPRWS